MWLSHQGSARATSSGRRLICISKGPPRPHPLPQPGPAMFTREPSAWGGPRGKPAQLSQASTPTSASRAPVGGRALCDQIQRRWLPRGPHAQSGDKEGSCALGSTIQGRLRARPGRRGPGVQPGSWGRPRGPRGPWLLAPAWAGGEPGLLVPAGALRPGCGVRASCAARARRRGPRARGAHGGGGLEPGRRCAGLPSPQPAASPRSSRLARGSRHRPSRGRRAKWRRSVRRAPRRRAPKPQRATSPSPGAPETVSATSPRLGALCPAGSRGSALPKDPHLPRARNDNGRKDEDSRAAARSSRPAPARLRT